MRREIQEELITRLKEMVDTGETTLVESERLNPVAEYHDPAHLEHEQELVLRRHPIVVAHSSQLREPRDYITDDLSGVPILVVRQEDGSLGAFLNVCRHRGVRVVSDQSGNRRSFSCPYHGWTYGSDGALKGIPHRQAFPDVDRDTRGLVPIPVEERHGLVWAVLNPDAELNVAAYLGPELDDELASYNVTDFALERTVLFRESLNWKSVIDGFLENYHIRYLHSDTLAKYVRTNVHTYDPFGPHARLVVVKTRFDKVRDLPLDRYPHEPLYYMSPVYHIFPNTVISWVGDHLESWTAFPDQDTPKQSVTRLSMIVPLDRIEEHDFWERSMKVILDVIPSEDFEMSRLMQRGLPARAQTHQVFGRNEGALQHFHEELERALEPIAGRS
jgi:phenylpropionate dioxygenase-like ring-hydroxylating dioxygenase large terminal subunit